MVACQRQEGRVGAGEYSREHRRLQKLQKVTAWSREHPEDAAFCAFDGESLAWRLPTSNDRYTRLDPKCILKHFRSMLCSYTLTASVANSS